MSNKELNELLNRYIGQKSAGVAEMKAASENADAGGEAEAVGEHAE